MTTKVLTGNYPTGFYLQSPVTILSITSTGVVEGKGVYTMADPPHTYTVINNGMIVGGASGVYLGDGGIVTNGSATDTIASISGYEAVKLQQAGTVTNFGSIISKGVAGFGIYFNEPGLLTNGSAQDTTAFIQGNVGVLMPGDMGVGGRVNNFGTIAGYGANSTGALIAFGGALTNGSASDAKAEIIGYDGVKGEDSRATLTNFGTILGQGSAFGAVGIDLAAGGKVTNGAAASVSAEIVGEGGIKAEARATVANFGKIAALGDTSAAVGLNEGGTVTNGAANDVTALIVGGRGVDISGAAGTVINFGTLAGSGRAGYFGSAQYAGVNLLDGGVLTNNATGLIEGYDGVLLEGAAKGSNLGAIQATGGYGARLYGGAPTLTNGSSGHPAALITGWVGVEIEDKATVTNFGSIAGTGGVAVILGDATARFNAEAGSVLKGTVQAGAGVVDFVSGEFAIDALDSGGMIEGAGTVTLDGGVSTLGPGVHLSLSRINVTGTATEVVFDSSLTFAEAWDQSAGILSVGSGDTVNFSGADDTFSGTLAGLGHVDFTGGSHTLSATTLTASTAIGAATVTLSGAITLAADLSASTANLLVAARGATLSGTGELNLGAAAADSLRGASAAAKLTVDAAIVGSGALGGGKMILAIGAQGSIENSNAADLIIDTGTSTITNAGMIAGAVTIESAIDNTGMLYAAGGTFTLNGSVTGGGIGEINGGVLDATSALAENVVFKGTSGVLELARSQAYAGTITGFSKTGGTALDLGDIIFGAATKASYSGTATVGVLTVTDGTHTARIKLAGNYTASVFTVSADGHGGTKVVDPTKTTTPEFLGAQAPLSSVTINGTEGTQGDPGMDGTPGGAAVATNTTSADTANSATANGGGGGHGGIEGPGGVAGSGSTGGAATATVATKTASAAGTSATANADAGGGGGAGLPGDPTTQGADGGSAGAGRASATDTNATGAATAQATAFGGNGGNAAGQGGDGGQGGAASLTKASAFGTTSAQASVTQHGGSGGAGGGFGGVGNGGDGASSSLDDAVTGATVGGTLTLYQQAAGGDGGIGGGGGIGGVAGAGSSKLTFDDTQSATQSLIVDSTSEAYSGDGGGGATGQNGGAATASNTLKVARGGDDVAQAYARDGGEGLGGLGGKGGAAKAVAALVTTSSRSSDEINVQAIATAGDGGDGEATGADGGAGGAAKATASANAAGAVSATVTASDFAGAGGAGVAGTAAGGAGASAEASNGVGGSTQGGSLSLTQNAFGGDGGDSKGGVTGAGGAAKSILTLDDTTQADADQSATLTANLTAEGGRGGEGQGAGVAGGAGGAATASLTLTGAQAVNATANAEGGSGGVNLSGSAAPAGGKGGAATATAEAKGVTVNADAMASGGTGQSGSGVAQAIAIGVGSAGTVASSANTTAGTTQLIQSIYADAGGTVDGQSVTESRAALSGTAPGFITADQGVAIGTGAPAAASVTAILAKNAAIKSAFGTAPVYFAIEELGGAHSSAGATSQTSTSEVRLSIDLNALAVKQDLILGLYNPLAAGAGFSDLRFTVAADETTLVSQDFSSLAAAKIYFTDNPLDLGSLTGAPFSGSATLQLDITMTVTTAKAGDSFDAGVLVGDPPPAASAALRSMAQAMAAFHPSPMGPSPTEQDHHPSSGYASCLAASVIDDRPQIA